MKFLVDANLPKYFSFFDHHDFSFVADIDTRMPDTDIWKHALQNNLILLTKDTDFFSRSLLAVQKPQIVYFRLGNMTLSEMHEYFTQHWKEIVKAIENNYLVVATTREITILI